MRSEIIAMASVVSKNHAESQLMIWQEYTSERTEPPQSLLRPRRYGQTSSPHPQNRSPRPWPYTPQESAVLGIPGRANTPNNSPRRPRCHCPSCWFSTLPSLCRRPVSVASVWPPLMLVASVFGMNFDEVGGLKIWVLGPAVGAAILAGLVLTYGWPFVASCFQLCINSTVPLRAVLSTE